MRIRSKIGIMAITAAVLTGVSLSSAAAATTGGATRDDSASHVTRQVQGLLAHNAGSVQVGADTVRLADGSTITALAPAQGMHPASASGRCPGGHLCLFVNSNFGGDQWTSSATSCAAVNLFDLFLSNGKSWADQASSIDDPLPRPGGSAEFFHANSPIAFLQAGHYLRNLATDGYNDRIESLYPCGH